MDDDGKPYDPWVSIMNGAEWSLAIGWGLAPLPLVLLAWLVTWFAGCK